MSYYLSSQIGGAIVYILPFTAGGFIYIAASDLIPKLHKEENLRRSLASFTFLFFWSHAYAVCKGFSFVSRRGSNWFE
jgi:zinc transporter ZupT